MVLTRKTPQDVVVRLAHLYRCVARFPGPAAPSRLPSVAARRPPLPFPRAVDGPGLAAIAAAMPPQTQTTAEASAASVRVRNRCPSRRNKSSGARFRERSVSSGAHRSVQTRRDACPARSKTRVASPPRRLQRSTRPGHAWRSVKEKQDPVARDSGRFSEVQEASDQCLAVPSCEPPLRLALMSAMPCLCCQRPLPWQCDKLDLPKSARKSTGRNAPCRPSTPCAARWPCGRDQ